jgi:hypothetical protein
LIFFPILNSTNFSILKKSPNFQYHKIGGGLGGGTPGTQYMQLGISRVVYRVD